MGLSPPYRYLHGMQVNVHCVCNVSPPLTLPCSLSPMSCFSNVSPFAMILRTRGINNIGADTQRKMRPFWLSACLRSGLSLSLSPLSIFRLLSHLCLWGPPSSFPSPLLSTLLSLSFPIHFIVRTVQLQNLHLVFVQPPFPLPSESLHQKIRPKSRNPLLKVHENAPISKYRLMCPSSKIRRAPINLVCSRRAKFRRTPFDYQFLHNSIRDQSFSSPSSANLKIVVLRCLHRFKIRQIQLDYPSFPPYSLLSD